MKNGNLNPRGAALAGAVALVVATFGGHNAAQAGVAYCQDLITGASFALNGSYDPNDEDCGAVQILGGHPDRTCASLNSKLNTASRKLDELKPEDAYWALFDFVAKIEDLSTLNAKGLAKIADGEYQTVADLHDAGAAARDCVYDLVTW